jgi:topoisomerase-4 subunit B
VVNALSDSMVVQVARNKASFSSSASRAASRLADRSKTGQRPTGAAPPSPSMPTKRSSAHHRFKPARLFKMVRSKAYLFSGVEIRWKSAIDDGKPRPRPRSTSPAAWRIT